MKHENMFSFEAIGWFRDWSKKTYYSQKKIPYVWIKIKIGNKHDEYKIFTIFLDRINLEQIQEIKFGSLIKLNGFISTSSKDGKLFFIPTIIKIIANNEIKSDKEFSELNTLVEKENVLQDKMKLNASGIISEIDDEIVKINW